MGTVHQTLLEQLKMSRHEISRRKQYFRITDEDCQVLASLREVVARQIDEIVEKFYDHILSFDEMDRLIGDADTLLKLKNHQRGYILSLFDGQYDEDYVHSRLRVGVVHRRIGVEPKYYVSAVYNLKEIIQHVLIRQDPQECRACAGNLEVVDKILLFDLSLIFDTYIHSLMDDVRRSQEELESYTESLEEIVSERTRLLKEQARRDGLTGLYNQQYFMQELRRELSRSQRSGSSICLVYFDLDGFKQINDTQGHHAGDLLLKKVAEVLKESIRENEVVGRYGGDEFCVILSDSTVDDAELFCNRLCELLKDRIGSFGVTCSMGIAASTIDNHLDGVTLVKNADKAMYEAKKEPGFSIRLAA